MWYREGTITFTKGSDTLEGTGTFWNVTANGVLPGMIVIGPDNWSGTTGRRHATGLCGNGQGAGTHHQW